MIIMLLAQDSNHLSAHLHLIIQSSHSYISLWCSISVVADAFQPLGSGLLLFIFGVYTGC